MTSRPFKKQIKTFFTGVSEEPTKIDERDFSGRRPSQVVCKNSIGAYVTILFLSVFGSITMAIVIDQSAPTFIYLIYLLPILLVIVSINQIRNRKPQLIINKTGIWTPKFEFPWNEVVSTKIRFEQGRGSFLIISNGSEDKVVDLSLLDISPRFLSHQIELMKRDEKSI